MAARPIESVSELIGDTPLLHMGRLAQAHGLPASVALYGKLECLNPGGSVKDRTATWMIDEAERSGRLKPGGTIVEGTAGNMGLGIALAALGRGYRVIFTVPTKFSTEKQALMQALGAEVINTPRAAGMQGAVKKAAELMASLPGAISLEQFVNPLNPAAHYATTGPEIFEALDGRVDYLVAGAGSGGTFTGIMRYLKERDPAVRGVLADPLGSIIGGGAHADYDIEGIGNDFIPATMDTSLVDSVVKVRDADALATARELARSEGVIAGSSSGAAVWAALEVARRLSGGQGEGEGPGAEAPGTDAPGGEAHLLAEGGPGVEKSPLNIVVVLPDRGDRYFSKGLYEFSSPGEGI